MSAQGPRVLLVSGKGGTGKTSVAAALALAAARRGRSVLLLELEGRPGAARLLGLRSSYDERPTALGFSIASVGPRQALLEYLSRFYGMSRLAGPIVRARVVDTVTQVAPGFRDLMLTGKVYETAEWRRGSTRGAHLPRYDLVVADAPPTGQIAAFLQAPAAFAEIIRVGRPGRQAQRIDAFLRRRSRLHLVTTLEELPVDETLESLAAISELGFPVGPVIVNRVLGPAIPRGGTSRLEELSPERLAVLARKAGVRIGARAARAALEVAGHHRAAEAEQRAQLRRLRGHELVELPMLLSARFGAEEITELSGRVEGLVP